MWLGAYWGRRGEDTRIDVEHRKEPVHNGEEAHDEERCAAGFVVLLLRQCIAKCALPQIQVIVADSAKEELRFMA